MDMLQGNVQQYLQTNVTVLLEQEKEQRGCLYIYIHVY